MKSIRIYQRVDGKDYLLVVWPDLPDCVLKWFAKIFDNPNMDSILRPFDLRNDKFVDFLDLCAFIKQGDRKFPLGVAHILNISEEDASALDHHLFIPFLDDVMEIVDQKLDNNLFWCIKEDRPGNMEQRQSCFEATISDVQYSRIGRVNAAIHVTLDILGLPLVHRKLRVGWHLNMFNKNDGQPVSISEEVQNSLKERNVGRVIKIMLSYKYDDEWSWDIQIKDKIKDIVNQLDHQGLPVGNF